MTDIEADEILRLADPAFPITLLQNFKTFTQTGLTKREWFAGMALQGMANQFSVMSPDNDVADSAIRRADAMIQRLKRPPHL